MLTCANRAGRLPRAFAIDAPRASLSVRSAISSVYQTHRPDAKGTSTLAGFPETTLAIAWPIPIPANLPPALCRQTRATRDTSPECNKSAHSAPNCPLNSTRKSQFALRSAKAIGNTRTIPTAACAPKWPPWRIPMRAAANRELTSRRPRELPPWLQRSGGRVLRIHADVSMATFGPGHTRGVCPPAGPYGESLAPTVPAAIQ